MKFPKAVTNKFGRQLLHLQKASPQVMFGAGVVGVVTAGVMACRATLKLDNVLDKAEQLREAALVLHEKDDDYSDEKYAKDLTVIKVKTALDVTKLYAPAVGLGAVSIALLTGSHVTLNRRNASLTAAYAAVDKAFEEYRTRVREELGTDKDRNFRYGVQEVEEVVENKNGTTKTVKHERVADGAPSQYAKFFDEYSSNHQRNPEYNKVFLLAQQNYFNDMLKARGHVFLNEVYDALDIPRTKAGAVVGWLLQEGGDNYVDFGIFDNLANPRVKDFVNGNEQSILLDFNVDGVIYDKI